MRALICSAICLISILVFSTTAKYPVTEPKDPKGEKHYFDKKWNGMEFYWDGKKVRDKDGKEYPFKNQAPRVCCDGCTCMAAVTPTGGTVNCCADSSAKRCECCKTNDCPGTKAITEDPPTPPIVQDPAAPAPAKQEGYSMYDEYGDNNQYITLDISYTTMCIILLVAAFIIASFIWNVCQCIKMNKEKVYQT